MRKCSHIRSVYSLDALLNSIIIYGLQLLQRPLTEHMTCADAENPASKKQYFLITAVNVIIVEVNNLYSYL